MQYFTAGYRLYSLMRAENKLLRDLDFPPYELLSDNAKETYENVARAFVAQPSTGYYTVTVQDSPFPVAPHAADGIPVLT